MTRQIHLAAFVMASHCAHSDVTWRHPRSDPGFLDPDYYRHLGNVLERGKFDVMFFGDSLSVPGRYKTDIQEALARGVQGAALLDPRVVVPMIAATTSKIGLASTASATYYSPFDVARLFGTLDHITRGRIGWNVVTSLAKADAQNFGYEDHLDHNSRYDRAEEFLEVAYKLWSSWEPDALVQDRQRGLFADPDLIHRVDHSGDYFNVRGPLTVPHSPQGRPVIFQAGASPRGKDFAARWAEAVFEVDPTSAGRKAYYEDIKSRTSDFGRDPNQVKIFPAVMPFVGETEAIAKERKAFHDELADPVSGLIMLSNLSDYDFSEHSLDEPLAKVDVPGTKGLFAVAQMLSEKDDLTLGDVAKLYAQSQLIPSLVGTGAQIADQIEQMIDNGEADGLMITASSDPGSFEDFVDLVVPELQRRGLFRREYEGSTLREHLNLDTASLTPPARRPAAEAH